MFEVGRGGFGHQALGEPAELHGVHGARECPA
jgi:hypothetical protein